MKFSLFGYDFNIGRAAPQRLDLTAPYLPHPPDEKSPYRALESQEKAVPSAIFGLRSTPFNALSGAPDKRLVETIDPRIFAGRKTKESPETGSFSTFWTNYGTRKRRWEATGLGNLSIDDFEKLDFDTLAEICAELSPEVSKALWDYLLLTNHGFEVTAYRTGTREKDPKAQAKLDDILGTLGRNHGTVTVFFDRLFKTIFLRGSYILELVLEPDLRTFADIAAPDTKTLEFKRVTRPVRGEGWTFGQKQRGEFVDLDRPNIRYVPLHPAPDSIEGTPLLTSVFFIAVFLMATLRDVKRVVQHQGYMRLDVQINFSELIETIPEDTRNNPEQLAAWMRECVEQVESVYSSLQPDDTYVHGSSITVNNPVGTVSADSIKGIDALFKALERMATRALKTMPLLMATDTTRGETQSNREWEVYALGIETVQHIVENPVADLLQMALNADGVQADVEVRFATFRAAEKMRDAQVDLLVAQLARFLYDCGVIGQDEMAQMMGREKADQTEPRNAVSNADPSSLQNVIQENPNPGESRQPTQPELDMMKGFLSKYAPIGAVRMFDAEIANEEMEN